MKIRILSILLALFFVASNSFAYDFEVDGLLYKITSESKKQVEVEKHNLSTKNLEIPSTVTYNDACYTVVSIGKNAFRGCTSLANIIIPSSVTSIGDYAFYDCQSLTSVDIRGNIKRIGEWEFGNCYLLTKFQIPESVEELGYCAFNCCKSLQNINIPQSVQKFSTSIFGHCSSLKNIELPNGLIEIPDYTFRDCTSLTDVVIPNSVKTIGNGAFSGCSSLSKLELPNSIAHIGGVAFEECSSLSHINISNDIGSIVESAFVGCHNLPVENGLRYAGPLLVEAENKYQKTYKIKEGTRFVGYGAFRDCCNLTDIVMPNAVTNIGCYSFENCKKLQNINFPNNIEYIGYSAFYDCFSLKNIYIPESVKTIYEKAFYECRIDTVYIPMCVTIESDAFGYSRIENLIIEDELHYNNAFYNAEIMNCYYNGNLGAWGNYIITKKENLLKVLSNNPKKNVIAKEGNDIYVPIHVDNNISDICSVNGDKDSIIVMNIKDSKVVLNLDEQIHKLFVNGKDYSDFIKTSTTITLPFTPYMSHSANLISICGITSQSKSLNINVTSSGNLINNVDLTKINDIEYLKVSGDLNGTDILVIRRMENLEVLDMEDANIVDGGESYYDCYTCSKDCLGDYILNSRAKLTSIVLPKSINTIGGGAFEGCTKLKYVSIPSNVKWLAYNSFEPLNTLILEDGDEDIGTIPQTKNLYMGRNSGFKFKGDSYIQNVVISCQVKEITSNMFYNCTNLTNITLSSNIKNIGNDAFYGCKSLRRINIPNSVISIGNESFYNCSSLEEIKMSYNVENIGYYAFYNCTSLKNISFNDGVKFNDNCRTFANCYNLKKVKLPNDITKIADEMFMGCSSLTDINMPNCLKTIGQRAFYNCISLDSLIIPDSVSTIETSGFEGCISLSKIKISSAMEKIYYQVFKDCKSLTDIIIPKQVTCISHNAFEGCDNLKQILSLNPTPPEIFEDTFDGIDYINCKLFVPVGSKTLYWLHPYWDKFFNIEELTEEQITSIPMIDISSDNIVDYISINNGTINILDSKAHVIVYSSNGQKVYDSKNSSSSITLPSNIYIVKVNDKLVKIKL